MADETVWKRPSEVMKIHRRRKSASQRRITTDADKRTSVIYKSPSKSVKRKNPFHKDSPHPNPSKRIHIDFKENLGHGGHDALSCQLFDMLDTADKHGPEDLIQSRTNEKLVSQKLSESSLPAISEDVFHKEKTLEQPKVVETKDENKVSTYLPIDWALKTKLRVVSSRPLSWCVQLKSADEAHGVTHFSQNTLPSVSNSVDEKRMFHRSCMYWIHPNIPWMKLFPRIIDDSKSSLTVSPLLQDDIQKNLQTDWEQSFTSVYHQLRSGLCPYFYVCTHQLTVLFHGGTETQSGLVAMVTPTTRGFRESLENEGITFKLPVGDKSQSSDKKVDVNSTEPSNPDVSEADGKGDNVDDDYDDLLDTDDAASGWLESMGLDKKQFPSLDPKKVKLQREGYRVIDHRPESLVLIEGGDVQAFFNFLLNCRTCTSMSGTQAGLPPTILSPSPFKGATLKPHKVKHTAVKQGDREGEITHAHIVEVTGPILPCHNQQFVSLFYKTQSADFGMVFNNSDPTVPFNILPSVLKTKCESSLNNTAVRTDSVNTSLNDSSTSTGKRNSLSTTLDTINEEDCDDGVKGEDRKHTSSGRTVLDVTGKFKNVAISDRVCAIKEIVCTPEGFLWNT